MNNAETTITNHLNQAGAKIFGCDILPVISRYKFTLEYSDGCTSEVAFKSTSRKEAKRALDYWCPGYETELGCQVTKL